MKAVVWQELRIVDSTIQHIFFGGGGEGGKQKQNF
jgi:hypothetical protein